MNRFSGVINEACDDLLGGSECTEWAIRLFAIPALRTHVAVVVGLSSNNQYQSTQQGNLSEQVLHDLGIEGKGLFTGGTEGVDGFRSGSCTQSGSTNPRVVQEDGVIFSELGQHRDPVEGDPVPCRALRRVPEGRNGFLVVLVVELGQDLTPYVEQQIPVYGHAVDPVVGEEPECVVGEVLRGEVRDKVVGTPGGLADLDLPGW